ncbi:hypothetical protein CMK12_17765 [Candidatus Poribacteria bacterium]|jgi:ligand-binding sensor domain-containing protein|nr:hypothetical protein [Candidatus Poribacteria bacterium]MDP6750668.1 two-component regulator propeller domain-containing protein [Candidatus Poribacteria bacterium]MDP6999453.1 two-component regulator propeller domain-containing protein [Candidatus Poribacteria bacterium]
MFQSARVTNQFILLSLTMKILSPGLIAFLFLIFSPLYSQEGWRQLTTNDGLSSNGINTIFQAQNGDIWIGTDEGVNRYNGVFEGLWDLFFQVNIIFQSSAGHLFARLDEPDGALGSNFFAVSSLHFFDGLEWKDIDILGDVSKMPEFAVESGGKLWVSTLDGLVGYDGQKWLRYDSDVDTNWLVKTPDGRLWTISQDLGGIASFDGQKWTDEFNTSNAFFGRATTNTALVTLTGQILLGTDKGLFQYNPDTSTLIYLSLDQARIHVMLETNDGIIWVIAQGQANQNLLYSFDQGKWTPHLPGESITTLYQSPDNHLWAGGERGLYQFDERQGWRQKLTLTAKVNCIYQLDNGTLLMGTDSGLWIESVTDVPQLTVEQHELFIKAIFRASNGVIWFRSDQGILSYDGALWIKHGIYSGSYGATGLRAGILEDTNGTVWFHGYYSTQTDPPLPTVSSFKDGKWEKYYVGTPGKTWTADITQTSDGRIWAFGAGGIWSHVKGEDWVSEATTPESTRGFIESPESRYWITFGGNISYFDGSTWVAAPNPPPSAGRDLRFFEDDNGNLWATGNGIYKWQETEKKWLDRTGDQARTQIDDIERVTFRSANFRSAKNSLDGTWRIMSDKAPIFATFDGQKLSIHPSSGQGDIEYRNVHDDGFVEYPVGVFWLATSNGLRRIEGDAWYDLTVDDGLPSNSVWCVMVDNQQYLWIGTEKGVVRYKPPTHLQPPAVKIKLIDGEDIPEDKIYLTGQSYVTIEWYGGDLQSPNDRLLYQYSIDGQWSQLKQNTLTTGLQNGEHRFVVRAIDPHFNASPVDSITIIVKTQAPYLSIGNPDNGDIVSGELYIKGRIKDDDFGAFQVFLSDDIQTDAPIFEDYDNEVEGLYQLIYEASARPRTATLAKLDTNSLDNGDYQIWLTAQDQLQHSSFDKIIFRVDNTPPAVKILTPKSSERVLKKVNISALASDIHLHSYRLDYTTDLATNEWDQIYVKSDLYKRDAEVLLPKPEMRVGEIQQEWEVPVKEGQVFIRLTATDIAGNTSSQTIQVEVPAAVRTRKGGIISPEDQQAELYFPPNTLAQDEIVTVNALPEVEVEPPVRRVSQIYDFAPTTLRLNAIKPATLTISYDPSQLSVGKEPLIFHRTDGPWKAVGGTPNPEQQTISAAVLSLGQYTLGEVDKIQAQDSANLKPDSLTCQPRVFSPKGNAFSAHTTISFTLDQPAQVTIKVYSVAGQLVEWIAQQRTFGSGKQAIRWAGRDSDGEIVASGLYIVTVTVGSQTQDRVVNVWNH